MLGIRTCPQCGIDVADMSVTTCPMCSSPLLTLEPRKITWIGALIQFAFMAGFMVLFRFPKRMILYVGIFLVVVTALSLLLKDKQVQPRAAQTIPLSRPTSYRILGAFIALGGFALVAILLFGFVIFINNWMRYQQYQGQPYHRADFIVTRTYYQKLSKGGRDIYASGTVDGQKEWMTLDPFLGTRPRDSGELEDRVPVGTSIPIYLFPSMKGRTRVRVYSDTPTAVAYHQAAMSTLNNALFALAIVIGVLFVLVRLQRATTNSS